MTYMGAALFMDMLLQIPAPSNKGTLFKTVSLTNNN